ncbi:predicted protein [Sclerotinia sclerotiorum 1980 UF-70]|uniref:Uncharacterized protein n=1 Tax=Sclerotinia sclerotiorum (strain ATCC 18683 / 1980 / Ss-1) TaxID=665079 RepID=A7EYA7_SCLS1|nr:predicted protein [Sclerotinia sclerotiorum 1980 UF-70]EDN94449.1 predicted protein [Sclerotinia sclerotiorum 1980 UF-70]
MFDKDKFKDDGSPDSYTTASKVRAARFQSLDEYVSVSQESLIEIGCAVQCGAVQYRFQGHVSPRGKRNNMIG